MKIIKNKWIPFRGFKSINLFGVVFYRGETPLTENQVRHEAIHTAQMRELLFVGFYVWYAIEYVVRLIQTRNRMKAYFSISFEREAYNNEDYMVYLELRSWFSFLDYL
jgi:hypothetical protein